ncbi:MAG: HdeD family acid-resistance protein [Gaiellaceae bacterium]
MSAMPPVVSRTLGRALPPWWLFLVTGISWAVVGFIVLRFDYTSVYAISILFGIVALSAGVIELALTMFVPGWWKLLYGVLSVAFIASGVISFIHPGDTFVALAAVISFFLVFAGTFDIIWRSPPARRSKCGGSSSWAESSSSCSGSGRRATTAAVPSSSSHGSPLSPLFAACGTSCSRSACGSSSTRSFS